MHRYHILKLLLHKFGIRLISEQEFLKYAIARDLNTLLLRNIKYLTKYSGGKLNFNLLSQSKSQIGQEIFAYIINGFAPGYFVEVGVGDGIFISNTKYLEELGWKGILVEPNLDFVDALRRNRNSSVEPSALWSESNIELEFISNGYISKLAALDKQNDEITKHGGGDPQRNLTYVKTITFQDLFEKYGVPKLIEYISIDVEGAEYEILQNFPFDSYKVKCWTIEHNFSPMRSHIYDLLRKHGYKRIFEDETEHDDFYVELNDTTTF